jgi:hypothetical protein
MALKAVGKVLSQSIGLANSESDIKLEAPAAKQRRTHRLLLFQIPKKNGWNRTDNGVGPGKFESVPVKAYSVAAIPAHGLSIPRARSRDPERAPVMQWGLWTGCSRKSENYSARPSR